MIRDIVMMKLQAVGLRRRARPDALGNSRAPWRRRGAGRARPRGADADHVRRAVLPGLTRSRWRDHATSSGNSTTALRLQPRSWITHGRAGRRSISSITSTTCRKGVIGGARDARADARNPRTRWCISSCGAKRTGRSRFQYPSRNFSRGTRPFLTAAPSSMSAASGATRSTACCGWAMPRAFSG